MKRESNGSLLSTVFVDYDNIYLSLKRKNEEAARRFAKNAGVWLGAIASGELITPTNGVPLSTPRRIVMNRCYGNPVPRRNAQDNATDMNSFPFVRHHYLRAGFEVIDCPPLTAQLKNSADIRMVMDVRDYLLHDTYFDEFIILSGDADFTPVLHRLRAHARRTVIYANDYTAAPYRAISDGEIREQDLISLLVNGGIHAGIESEEVPVNKGLPSPETLTKTRSAILNEVMRSVSSSPNPVPLEALADRAVRELGHDKTVGTAWGGAGSFRDLLLGGLPENIKLSQEAPYYVIDANSRQQSLPPAATTSEPAPKAAPEQQQKHARTPHGLSELPSQHLEPAVGIATGPRAAAPAEQNATHDLSQHRFAASNEPDPSFASHAASARRAQATGPAPSLQPNQPQNNGSNGSIPLGAQGTNRQSDLDSNARRSSRPDEPSPEPQSTPSQASDSATTIQRSIARIHEACQAPPLSPPEYRALFDVMASEIKTNGLTGARTLVNIVQTAQEIGVNLRRDDARFILEVVSEADPWFENGASANLFASRFRNFVVARCRSQGLNLSADELDLIDAWFAGSTTSNGQLGPGAASLASQASRASGVTTQEGFDRQSSSAASHSGLPPASAQQHQTQRAPQPQIAPAGSGPRVAGSAQISQTAGAGNASPAKTPAASYDPFGGVPPSADQDLAGPSLEDDAFPRIITSRARG